MGAKYTTERRGLSVRTATWNLGNEVPKTGWSFLGAEDKPDIYAVGVQEAVYNPREGFIDMEMDLFLSIHRAVGEDEYEVVMQQSLTPRTDKTYKSKEAFIKAYNAHPDKMSPSGIRLIVLAKKTLTAEGLMPTDVEVNVRTCGRLDGVSGNKGALSVTCRIGDVWVSFMTAHLNAHTEQLERRIADYESVMFGFHAPLDTLAAESEDYVAAEAMAAPAAAGAAGAALHPNSPMSAAYLKNIEVNNRSHVTLFMGDFNFRLEALDPKSGEPLSHEDQCKAVEECLDLRQWDEMATYDQLLREQKRRRCFHTFTECKEHPHWAPTFKLNKKPDKPGVYNLKRCPSWCDRVLLRTAHGGKCDHVRYVAHHDYEPNTSDHVPVTADFRLEAWRTHQHHGSLHAAASKLFRSTTMQKERSIEITKLKFHPDHEYILGIYEDTVEEGMPDDVLGASEMLVALFHAAASERTLTGTVKYDPKIMEWLDPLELKFRASVPDVFGHPLLIAVRTPEADNRRLHRQGEAMLDVRALWVWHR